MQPNQETLFYIVRDQEQEGPISWGEMQGLLASGELQPDHLCWSEGMDAWVSVGSLMPTARSVPAPLPEREAEEINPYAPPSADLSDKLPAFVNHGGYGGIARVPYLILTVGLSIMQGAVTETLNVSASLVMGVMGLFIVGTLWTAWMRIKNLGISGWWLLGMFVPVMNIVAGYRFMFCPEGWGDSRTLDKGGKIALGIFIALMLLVFAAAIFLPEASD